MKTPALVLFAAGEPAEGTFHGAGTLVACGMLVAVCYGIGRAEASKGKPWAGAVWTAFIACAAYAYVASVLPPGPMTAGACLLSGVVGVVTAFTIKPAQR